MLAPSPTHDQPVALHQPSRLLMEYEQPPSPEHDDRDPITVFLASTQAADAGFLHGRWLRADVPEDELLAAAAQLQADSPIPTDADKYVVLDHDGFLGLQPGDHVDDLAGVSFLARALRSYGPPLACLIEHIPAMPLEMAVQHHEASFQGEYMDVHQWAVAHLGTWDGADRFVEDCLRNEDIWVVYRENSVYVYKQL